MHTYQDDRAKYERANGIGELETREANDERRRQHAHRLEEIAEHVDERRAYVEIRVRLPNRRRRCA